MSTGKKEALKAATSAGVGAVGGVALFEVIGGVGVAAGGAAFGLTAGPFIAIGAGIGLTGYGLYRLGKQVGSASQRR